MPLVELDSSIIDLRLKVEADRFEAVRVALNTWIKRWNEACDAKKLNMYAPYQWDNDGLSALAQEFAASVEALESRADEIEEAIRDRSKHREKLELENSRVARLECDSLVASFNAAKTQLSKATVDLERARKDLEIAVNLEATLSAELMNAQVAVDDINASLRAIFAENGRLTLALKVAADADPRYVLKSRGRAVSPRRLSIGERNIVALAYYFLSVRKRLDELESSASDRWFIVGVDDPVSSMDMDNRLGIHGFLDSQVRRIFMHGHKRVKVVLLTHDLAVARELEKASNNALFSAEIAGNSKSQWTFGRVGSQLITRFELRADHRLVGIAGKLSGQNDYGKLINLMWKGANEKLTDDETFKLTIGNVTRRVLEAFSTFIYNDSSIPAQALALEYSRVTSGADLLVDLGSGHRMFLHEYSHSEDRLTSMSDFGGIAGIDPDEQILHVRKVLAFMFTLQPYHVTSFLVEKANITVPILESWCTELLGQQRVDSNADYLVSD
jgi:wobble nucleotide-excising tRNase